MWLLVFIVITLGLWALFVWADWQLYKRFGWWGIGGWLGRLLARWVEKDWPPPAQRVLGAAFLAVLIWLWGYVAAQVVGALYTLEMAPILGWGTVLVVLSSGFWLAAWSRWKDGQPRRRTNRELSEPGERNNVSTPR